MLNVLLFFSFPFHSFQDSKGQATKKFFRNMFCNSKKVCYLVVGLSWFPWFFQQIRTMCKEENKVGFFLVSFKISHFQIFFCMHWSVLVYLPKLSRVISLVHNYFLLQIFSILFTKNLFPIKWPVKSPSLTIWWVCGLRS